MKIARLSAVPSAAIQSAQVLGADNELLVGFQTRYDFLHVSRTPSKDAILAVADPSGYSEWDRVRVGNNALYVQANTRWSDWFRLFLSKRLCPVQKGRLHALCRIAMVTGRSRGHPPPTHTIPLWRVAAAGRARAWAAR
jgi:hypothetical protein